MNKDRVPSISSIVKLCSCSSITTLRLLQCEVFLLNQMGWAVSFATSFDFLAYFCASACASSYFATLAKQRSSIFGLAEVLLDFCLHGDGMVRLVSLNRIPDD
jgi:hypothetical protein